MGQITTARKGEMLRTLFRILAEEPEGLRAKDAIARVEGQMELTEFERATFPENPDLVRFPKLLRFATIPAVKAGWLLKQGGTWTLTDDGKAALAEFREPESFFRECWRLYKSWEADQPDRSAATVDSGVDEESRQAVAAASLEEAEEIARDDILAYLSSMNPYTFQDLVGKLLEGMGYHVVWVAPQGKDGGLDLLAQSDPLGTKGPRIKGQVKRRADSKTAEEELRSFLSLIEPEDVGVYISLGGFTRDAEALSRRTQRRITLINGNGLIDLWIDHYDEIDEQGRQLFPLKAVHFLDRDPAG